MNIQELADQDQAAWNEATQSLYDEIDRLTRENWQLKQALGYPIPAEHDTPQNPFKCGVCDARAKS